MTSSQNGVCWTPKMFEKLVERYVFRTKITENFKEAILEMNEENLLNVENGLKLIKLLFNKGEEMKETYGSPEELMRDLYIYQNFPCNSEFLGLENSLNYHAITKTFETYEGYRFFSILDAYVAFVRVVVEPHYKFSSFLAKSIGNSIGRHKKNSFNFTSDGIFNSLVEWEDKLRNRLVLDLNFKHETIDEVYSFLSQYYNENDVDLLAKLKKTLNDENERHPISKNPEHYERICANHACFNESIRRSFFNSKLGKCFLNWECPIVRLFDDKERMNPNRQFFFAKELENALDIAMKKHHEKEFPKGLFPVETEEDRKLGILRIVTLQTFNKVLKILKLPKDSVHIVVGVIEKTSRDNQVPFNSPYGTYCVLANHAFVGLFQQVSFGMQLFRRVNKENVPKIIEWFENLDIFDESRKYPYALETWKVDEIIDCAYRDLQQYSTEPIHKLSKPNYGRHETLKELLKFSPNIPNQNVLRKCYEACIGYQPNKKFSPRHVHSLYESAIFFAFIDASAKYSSFLANHGRGGLNPGETRDIVEQFRSMEVKH